MIEDGFRIGPVVCLLGPRQCGKTTLAHQYVEFLKKKGEVTVHFLDLEDPTHLARLQNPRLALQDLKGLIVLDEIQRTPEIFPVLRVFSDLKKKKTPSPSDASVAPMLKSIWKFSANNLNA